MRSVAREKVFKYLFSRLFNQTDEGLFAVLCKDLSDDDKNFAGKLFNIVTNSEGRYTEEITKLSQNFKFNRIFAADKCALSIGMAELDGFPETPKAVVIDEAVKLAAKFSTEKSADFVNGILAEYAKNKK
ncbi:MAG: transcription antitermination protein NusB [Clostridia bacterium]|nr:transcription antitermination protein NusB [Clostridia bacterium]